MALPILAAAGIAKSVISGAEAARIEAHIQDRIRTYQTFTNEKLIAIINTYGGEMGEAAKRVLATRPASSDTAISAATSGASPGTQALAANVVASGGMNPQTLLILGAALLLLFALRR